MSVPKRSGSPRKEMCFMYKDFSNPYRKPGTRAWQLIESVHDSRLESIPKHYFVQIQMVMANTDDLPSHSKPTDPQRPVGWQQWPVANMKHLLRDFFASHDIVHAHDIARTRAIVERSLKKTKWKDGLALPKAVARTLKRRHAERAIPLAVMTLNIGHNIQSNRLRGSEKAMVQRCQAAFNGDALGCTRISAMAMHNSQADIVCLQEASKNGVKAILTELNIYDPTDRYTYVRDGPVAIVYRERLGATVVPETFRRSDEDGVRGFVAVVVGDVIYASLWLGHFDSKQVYRRVFHDIGERLAAVPHTRVVIGMDSNDHNATLYRAVTETPGDLRVGPYPLRLPSRTIHKTCCEDTEYAYHGDYIMDTGCRTTSSEAAYHIPTLYGLTPKNGALGIVHDGKQQLMSDHLPLLYRMKYTISRAKKM
jgi:hypothetical protein